MTRFILCSFALVLLYPTAIDLYLVGLPQIARDLGASESQLHIAFSVYLAGMATTMVFAGKLSDVIGRRPIAIAGAIIFTLASLMGCTVENSQSFLIVRFIQGIAQAVATWSPLLFCVTSWTINAEQKYYLWSMG